MSRLRILLVAWAMAFAAPALAAPGDYDPSAGYTITPPYSAQSFSTSLAAFPASSTRRVDGYPLAGRMLAATGRELYLQTTFGSSEWAPVAVLDESDPSMDPSFVAITPDGETIALGTGFGKPLYVFPVSLLSLSSPVVLTTSPSAFRYVLDYYDAAFRDDRYLFVNAGGGTLGESFVYAIDTESPAGTMIPIVTGIPGASGGIAFDASGNLVTGIGWDPDFVRTGDLSIFPASAIDAVLAGEPGLDYDDEGLLLATGMISAASLGFDGDGNLFVGGGDLFGTSGNFGYANLIDASVMARVLAGGAPLDPMAPGELARLQPDPCHNDDSTRVVYVPGVDMLLVTANLASLPPTCESVDWSTGPTGPMTIYFPPDAPDEDGDGIPDGVDPDHLPRRIYGRAELSRLVDAFDAVAGDAGFDAGVDFDASGVIDDDDFVFLRARWGAPLPD